MLAWLLTMRAPRIVADCSDRPRDVLEASETLEKYFLKTPTASKIARKPSTLLPYK